MKTKPAILVIIALLLAACEPTATPTQEIEFATQLPIVTEEPVATESPVATEPPAQVPTEAPTETPIPTATPLACVTLLAPLNGTELPPVGKVTFSWTPLDGAESYLLNIILPSGETVTFKTDKTTYDRYMEAFAAGGEYQWNVTAQGADGSVICISPALTFDKPEKPGNSGNSGGDAGSSSGSGSGGGSSGGDLGPGGGGTGGGNGGW